MALPEVENNTKKTALDTENDVFARQMIEEKPRKSVGRRILKGVGLAILAMAVGGAAYVKFAPNGAALPGLVQDGWNGAVTAKTNPDLLFDNVGSQVNILLIGRDVNWKIGKVFDPKTGKYRPFQVIDKDTPARSDTMIVVSLNKENKTIRMVSLPRDAMVRLSDNDYGVHRAKLNAAHAYGGPPLLIKTLQEELGLTIHRYAVIKFDGFKKLIDQVGGIEVNVDGALKKGHDGKLYRGNLDYDDNWGNLHIHLKPGMQKLDGVTAHNYVRFRMDREGDPGRIRRQQQVMRALAKQMSHVNFWELPGLIQEVQKQFATDMSTSELASAAAFAKGIGDASKIQPLTLFGAYSTRGSVLLNKSKNEKLLSYIFGNTFNAEHFLQRSPSTTTDEFGPANDATPDAKKILEAAGILHSDDELKENSANEAPIRVEETSSTSSSTSATERHNRYASSNEENKDEEKPRSKKKSKSSASQHESDSKTRPSAETASTSSAQTHDNSSEQSIISDVPARHETQESPSESPSPESAQ